MIISRLLLLLFLSVASVVPLLADPGTLVLAVGLERIVPSYTGPAIRIKRPVDLAEQDIGFAAGRNNLDTNAVSAFLGTSQGWIVKLYAQDGNGKDVLAPSSTDNMPTISVAAPSTIMVGGVPNLTARNVKVVFSLAEDSSLRYFIIPSTVSVNKSQMSAFLAYHPDYSGGPTMSLFEVGNPASDAVDLMSSELGLQGLSTSGKVLFGSNAIYSPQQPTVLGLTTRPNAQATVYLDGVAHPAGGSLVNSALCSGGYLLAGTGTSFYYGQSLFGQYNFLAFALYNGTANAADAAAISAAMLPLSTPPTFNLVADGDSITQGTGSVYGMNMLNYVETQLSRPTKITNLAVTGTTTLTSLSHLTSPAANPTVQSLYEPSFQKNIYYLAIGTNDIHEQYKGGPEVWANVVQILQTARGMGYKTVLATIMPTSNEDNLQAEQVVYFNTQARAALAQSLIDGLVDYQADSRLGIKTNFYPAYSNDGTHPNDAGYQVMASIAAPVFNQILTGTSTPSTYLLTVNSGSGGGTYAPGASVTVTANAAPSGYNFSGWTGATAALANPLASSTILTMPAAATSITATYAPIPISYPLTVNSGSGSGSYASGATVPVKANAAPSGFNFAAWTGATGALANRLAASTTLTMPAAATSITATYVASSGGATGAVTSVQFPQYYGHQIVSPLSGNNYTAGVIPVQNWNVADTDTGTSPAGNATGAMLGSSTLNTSTGAATSFGFTYSGYTRNDGTNNGSFPSAVWYQAGGLADSYLAAGSSFNENGAAETLQLSGLDASHSYTLIAYITAPWWANGSVAAVTVNGTTYYVKSSNTLGTWVRASSTSSATPTTGNYVQYALSGSTSQNVTLLGAYVGLAGFQIVDNGSSGGSTTYPLTVTNGSGSGSYAAGASVPVTANAAPVGYMFSNWTGATSALANPLAAATTLTMPATAAGITANYVVKPPTTYALTVNNGSGSGSYVAGASVPVMANAAPSGYVFSGWSGATAALADPLAAFTTLTMPAAATSITANYVVKPPATYALTVNSGSGSGSYAAGTIVTVTANAAPSGYSFSSWSGTTSALANPLAASTTLTMPSAAATITANYITSVPSAVGTVTSVQFPQYYSHQIVDPMNGNNYTGGVVPVQGWNVADTDTGTSPASNATGAMLGSSTLLTSTGASTPFGFTLAGYTRNDGTNNRSFPSAVWYQTGGLADAYLAAGSTFNESGAAETLTISGLDPLHNYTLIVYVTAPWWAYGGSAPASITNRGTTYYIKTANTLATWTKAASTASASPTTGNYVQFTLSGNSSQTVTLAGAYVGLAAFQLIDNGAN